MIQLANRRSWSLACLALLVLPLPWLAPGLLLAHLLRRGRGFATANIVYAYLDFRMRGF